MILMAIAMAKKRKQEPNIDLSNIDISNIDKIVGQVYRIQMMKRITALSNTVILTFYA